MSDPGTLMNELTAAARGLDKAATRLADLTREFEGPIEEAVNSETGEIIRTWTPGPQLLFEDAVAEEEAAIYTRATEAEEKPPPEAVRKAMAKAKVKRESPDLYADYHRLRSEIQSLQRWISAKKETISARQSVLSAEKELARAA